MTATTSRYLGAWQFFQSRTRGILHQFKFLQSGTPCSRPPPQGYEPSAVPEEGSVSLETPEHQSPDTEWQDLASCLKKLQSHVEAGILPKELTQTLNPFGFRGGSSIAKAPLELTRRAFSKAV